MKLSDFPNVSSFPKRCSNQILIKFKEKHFDETVLLFTLSLVSPKDMFIVQSLILNFKGFAIRVSSQFFQAIVQMAVFIVLKSHIHCLKMILRSEINQPQDQALFWKLPEIFPPMCIECKGLVWSGPGMPVYSCFLHHNVLI